MRGLEQKNKKLGATKKWESFFKPLHLFNLNLNEIIRWDETRQKGVKIVCEICYDKSWVERNYETFNHFHNEFLTIFEQFLHKIHKRS